MTGGDRQKKSKISGLFFEESLHVVPRDVLSHIGFCLRIVNDPNVDSKAIISL